MYEKTYIGSGKPSCPSHLGWPMWAGLTSLGE
jgi:hypothetical protein